tara:strand:+ start:658 stop:1179 length:522 start_codon:yes stop_codon:yes gene_type:complete
LLYVASFSSTLESTLRICKNFLGNKNFSEYQYIDLGCGKGKSLIYYLENYQSYSKYSPIGIEYDHKLFEIANKNLINICGYSSDDFNLILDSATKLNLYLETNKLIIYLYNSFQGKTLDAVLDILEDYHHLIIYIDPAEQFKIQESNYKIIASKKGKYNANTWLIAQKIIDEN